MSAQIQYCISSQKWPSLEIRQDLPEGRGVFATDSIPVGNLVCNYGGLTLNIEKEKKESEIYFNHPVLKNFVFEISYTVRGKSQACLLCADNIHNITHGMLINHSEKHPNVTPKVYMLNGKPEILFRVTKELSTGMELCWNYGKHFQHVTKCVSSCAKCGLGEVFITIEHRESRYPKLVCC